MPHTKQPRCNQRNTGRRRVTETPNTTHRMNSRCNARIAAANAEYTLPFPYAAFFCCALVLAQRARCAAAIFFRTAWLIVRTGADPSARLVFAHRALWAAAIFLRAAADIVRRFLAPFICASLCDYFRLTYSVLRLPRLSDLLAGPHDSVLAAVHLTLRRNSPWLFPSFCPELLRRSYYTFGLPLGTSARHPCCCNQKMSY